MAGGKKAAVAVESYAELTRAWGFEIDPELLVLALTHRSFAHENGNLPTNERLEFLGDAVLQIIVTEYLYRAYPDLAEGELARMRAATVSQKPLAAVARGLGLGQYLLLGVGESNGGGRDKSSILCDTVEALIGATYLCSGLETTRRVVEKHLRSLLRSAHQRGIEMDWKTTLQEHIQALALGELRYEVTGSGPDHNRRFSAQALVGEDVWGSGEGTSKRGAEIKAAEAAVAALRQAYPQLQAGDHA